MCATFRSRLTVTSIETRSSEKNYHPLFFTLFKKKFWEELICLFSPRKSLPLGLLALQQTTALVAIVTSLPRCRFRSTVNCMQRLP
jgi:hypothetical protein